MTCFSPMLQCHDDGWLGCQAKLGQILTFEVELNCFLKIARDFIKGRTLGNHRNFHALGYISRLLSRTDNGFYGALYSHIF